MLTWFVSQQRKICMQIKTSPFAAMADENNYCIHASPNVIAGHRRSKHMAGTFGLEVLKIVVHISRIT